MQVSGRLMSAHAFPGFPVEREVVHPNILRKKVRVKVPEALPRANDPEDLKTLLLVISHISDRAIILMLLRTGMRIGELLSATIPDINLKEKKVIIYEAQKTRAGRVFYFSDDGKEAIDALLKARYL